MQIPPADKPGSVTPATDSASTNRPAPASSAVTLPKSLLQGLQSGQILIAKVLNDTQPNGTTALRVRDSNVTLHSTPTLRQGQQLTLQITDPAQGLIQARVQTTTANNITQLAAREALPLQMALAPLFSSLVQISQSAAAASANVPEALRQLAQEILRQIPRWQSTRGSSELRQAIAQSGIFLEAMLGKSGVPESDLKANLLRLLAALQGHNAKSRAQMSAFLQAPPPLRYGAMHAPELGTTTSSNEPINLANVYRQLLGALARIELAQLASTAPDGDKTQVLMTEVPLRNDAGIDVIQLRIEQEAQESAVDQSKEKVCTIQLAFELSGLGPLYVRLGLRGDHISTTFWTERTQTKQLIDKHLDQYRENLRRAGVLSGPILTQVGRPPDTHKRPITPQLIVDVKV